MCTQEHLHQTHTLNEIKEMWKTASFDEEEKLFSLYVHDSRRSVQTFLQARRRAHEKESRERTRVREMYALEHTLGGELAIGIDEVGRGPLAGPLTVAAVVLPQAPFIWGLNDSKQLTPSARERLDKDIRAHARFIAITHIDPQTIDACGMAACLRRAMKTVSEQIPCIPTAVLIDGNPVHICEKEQTIVKGDSKIASIAAASIVAKVARDRIMCEMDEKYPLYHFAENKGYGSAAHIEAIKRYGLSPIHRASFCTHFVG